MHSSCDDPVQIWGKRTQICSNPAWSCHDRAMINRKQTQKWHLDNLQPPHLLLPWLVASCPLPALQPSRPAPQVLSSLCLRNRGWKGDQAGCTLSPRILYSRLQRLLLTLFKKQPVMGSRCWVRNKHQCRLSMHSRRLSMHSRRPSMHSRRLSMHSGGPSSQLSLSSGRQMPSVLSRKYCGSSYRCVVHVSLIMPGALAVLMQVVLFNFSCRAAHTCVQSKQ